MKRKENIESPISFSGTSNGDQTGDLFDPQRLKISQNYADRVGVRKMLITVPVRKPDRQDFVRVHSDPEFRLDTLVLDFKEDREFYLVDPSLGSELPGEITAFTLFTAITRQDMVFLWPIRLPDPNGKQNEWHETARTAAAMAMKRWIRLVSNMSLRGYEIFEATGDLPEPEWPKASFQELLKIAFKDRFIRSMEHTIVQRLRGAK